ncbi:hypothetical protein [Nonomuraea roseola]|uniref:Uncharacterized protein n=1 Tax=Nonomuraea roseola TaxID=46179 RepID=A0ABV5PP61_9ACTN
MVEDRSPAINHWLAVWELNSLYARDTSQGEGRRAWAEAAMYALARAEDEGVDKVDADVSRFHLRANVITDLGSNGNPLWDPDTLGVDILQALPLSRQQAAAWSVAWSDQPLPEILTLRRCKNLVNTAKAIREHLTEPTTAHEIDQWLILWKQLP